MKHKAFSLLYIIVFCLLLAFAFYENTILHQVTRPCVVFSLLIYFFIKTRLKGRFHKRLFTGLVFAGIGDLLIAYHQNDASLPTYTFIAFGLSAIFYIRAFYLDFRSAPELDKRGARIGIALCAILGMGFYIYLRPYTREAVFSVMLATFLMNMVMMMAVFRNLRVNKNSFNLILAGVACLVLTVALFAVDSFITSFHAANVLLLAGYMVGQYLVVIGGIERELLHK